MSKFKVGDKVRRIGSSWVDVVHGQEYVVSGLWGDDLKLRGCGSIYTGAHFELVEEPPKTVPHKYAALIKAWADGAQIEVRFMEAGHRWGEWVTTPSPRWSTATTVEYRIKPEPKPDVQLGLRVWPSPSGLGLSHVMDPNVLFTFDGETGKLKSATVINKD